MTKKVGTMENGRLMEGGRLIGVRLYLTLKGSKCIIAILRFDQSLLDQVPLTPSKSFIFVFYRQGSCKAMLTTGLTLVRIAGLAKGNGSEKPNPSRNL